MRMNKLATIGLLVVLAYAGPASAQYWVGEAAAISSGARFMTMDSNGDIYVAYDGTGDPLAIPVRKFDSVTLEELSTFNLYGPAGSGDGYAGGLDFTPDGRLVLAAYRGSARSLIFANPDGSDPCQIDISAAVSGPVHALACDLDGNVWVTSMSYSGGWVHEILLLNRNDGSKIMDVTASDLSYMPEGGTSWIWLHAGIDVGSDGTLYIADYYRIISCDPCDISNTIKVFAGDGTGGSGGGQFNDMAGIKAVGDRVYAGDPANYRVQAFDLAGDFVGELTSASLTFVLDVEATPTSNYIYLLEASELHRFSADTDADGVGDTVDLCPGSDPCFPVEINGCLGATDVDDDADVDFDDLLILFGNWLRSTGDLPCSPLLPGSIDSDCDVDLNDYATLLAGWTGSITNTQGPFTLVSGGANPADIIVTSTQETIVMAVEELAEKLEAISGVKFTIKPPGLTSGKRGIVIGLADDFTHLPPNAFNFDDGGDPDLTSPAFLREQYIIYSTRDAVCLIGKTPLAVQHAVWDLLHRLGYRQYFPRSIWEHVPSNDTLTIDVHVDETPDYRSRMMYYNGSYLLNYPEWDNQTPLFEWRRRNRMAQGFTLTSSHSYGTIASNNQSVFDANPQYYALVDGARQSWSINVKLCIDNPGLVATSNTDAVVHGGAGDSISREPSDSGGWCECNGVYDPVHNPDSTNCVGNFSSISDRVVYLANQAAEALIGAGYTDKYVSILGYNQHSAAPVDTMVHPKVLVSIATAFSPLPMTYVEQLESWMAMGATLGTYDYFSVYQWDRSKPRLATAAYPRDLASDLRDYNNAKSRFLNAEAGDSWGPHGLGYYFAARVSWDVDEADNVDAAIEEFLSNMFGPAAAEMRLFYDLINKDKQGRSEIGIMTCMYKYLDDAVTAASGNAKALARIYEMVKYTYFCELRYNLEWEAMLAGENPDVPASNPAVTAAQDALCTFAYRIRLNGLVHAFRVWMIYGHNDWGMNDPDYYIKDHTPIDEAELLAMLAAGTARFNGTCVP